MNSVMQADIFFFISSIGFVLLFVLLMAGLISMLRILRSVRRMAKRLESSVEELGDEAKELVADVRESLVYRILFGKKKSRSK